MVLLWWNAFVCFAMDKSLCQQKGQWNSRSVEATSPSSPVGVADGLTPGQQLCLLRGAVNGELVVPHDENHELYDHVPRR